jgi:hypothetical protein
MGSPRTGGSSSCRCNLSISEDVAERLKRYARWWNRWLPRLYHLLGRSAS